MSSRHRRSMTLKRFDALYRRGRHRNVTTGTSRPETTPTSRAEDTPTGQEPSIAGTLDHLNSGLRLSSTIEDLQRRLWEQRLDQMAQERDLWSQMAHRQAAEAQASAQREAEEADVRRRWNYQDSIRSHLNTPGTFWYTMENNQENITIPIMGPLTGRGVTASDTAMGQETE